MYNNHQAFPSDILTKMNAITFGDILDKRIISPKNKQNQPL
jgi:hypothetical protein